MDAVDSDSIERMEPWQWLALVAAKSDVPSQGLDRAARFNATDHITFCELLILQAYRRLDKDPGLRQSPQGSARQYKSAMCP